MTVSWKETAMKALMRTAALIVGVVGATIGFAVSMLYSLYHTLARLSGLPANQSHFFIGTGLALLGGIGAVMASVAPGMSALLMVVAAIGFFFILGWWAVIPAVCLVVAAVIALLGRESQLTAPART
jgi:hypothetical protein